MPWGVKKVAAATFLNGEEAACGPSNTSQGFLSDWKRDSLLAAPFVYALLCVALSVTPAAPPWARTRT